MALSDNVFVFNGVLSVMIDIFFWLVYFMSSEYKCDKPLRTFILGVAVLGTGFIALVSWTFATSKVGTGLHNLGSDIKNVMVASFFTVGALIWSVFILLGTLWTLQTGKAKCHKLLYGASMWYLVSVYARAAVYGLLSVCNRDSDSKQVLDDDATLTDDEDTAFLDAS